MFLISFDEGSYFLSKTLRSEVECMGEGVTGTVGRIKKKEKDGQNQYTNNK